MLTAQLDLDQRTLVQFLENEMIMLTSGRHSALKAERLIVCDDCHRELRSACADLDLEVRVSARARGK